VFYLLFKRNRKENNVRVILFYVIYCILNEAVSFYLQSIRSRYSITLFNLFTVVEFSFFCFFLYSIFAERKTKLSILGVWAAFMLFAFVDYFIISKSQEFDYFTSGIESIVIILLCIYYLYRQLKRSTNLMIYSTFNFWVVITFLIYFCGTFFLYLFAESMRESATFQKQYFIINISFNILKNILLCIAMTMKLSKPAIEEKTVIPDLDDDLFIRNKINSVS